MDQVAQVREKIDIVQLISEFIPLKKMGRNFTTTCPFHAEKTPSFVVSPERQIWHCFGCGIGGDCFTFLMQYENMEFPEALRNLAKRAGIILAQTAFSEKTSSAKEKIYRVNRLAAEFYHYVLTAHKAGKAALLYLTTQRKIKMATIKTFLLGFAPKDGNSLSLYLMKKKGYQKKDLTDGGLATGGSGDFFRNRLIFPLFDHRDNVLGFAGRVLADTLPKYINTRETLVYHKGSIFFGLNSAKQNIKKENRAIVMEGELDVIAAFQEGVTNAVAIKGTALTQDHALLLSRFTNNVSLCFDQDSAGKEAIIRSLPYLEARGFTTHVTVLTNGKDADEAIRNNPALFKQAVKHDTNIYDYLISQEILANDVTSSEGKKRTTDVLLPILSRIDNEVVKEHYLRKLARELDTSYESITRQTERMREQTGEKQQTIVPREKRSRKELLEEYLVALLIQSKNPLQRIKLIEAIIPSIDFVVPAYERICKHLFSIRTNTLDLDAKKISNALPKELLPAFDACSLLPLPSFPTEEAEKAEIVQLANELQTLSLKAKIKEVGEKIKETEKKGGLKGSDEALMVLKEEFTSLIGKLQEAV